MRSAGLAGSVILVLAAVVISGFLYGPAPRLAAGVRHFAVRVVGARGSAFVDLAGVTIRNVARGVIGVALIQSLLIGFALIVAEVPAAGLLTLAVLVLGILQIGVGSRWSIPLLIWAWVTRDTMPALFLTLYMIPAALIDNVLKPMLMGKGLRDAGAGDPRRRHRRHDLLRADRPVPRAGGARGLLRPAAVLDGRRPRRRGAAGRDRVGQAGPGDRPVDAFGEDQHVADRRGCGRASGSAPPRSGRPAPACA